VARGPPEHHRPCVYPIWPLAPTFPKSDRLPSVSHAGKRPHAIPSSSSPFSSPRPNPAEPLAPATPTARPVVRLEPEEEEEDSAVLQ
jgi:hypothetical protein